jgi:hypothetical protein
MASLSQIPAVPHFAILRTTSVTTPGDERSRTNPGHGYPESTETFITYRAFIDREEWEAEIKMLSSRPYEKFVAIAATPARISTSVSVSVD